MDGRLPSYGLYRRSTLNDRQSMRYGKATTLLAVAVLVTGCDLGSPVDILKRYDLILEVPASQEFGDLTLRLELFNELGVGMIGTEIAVPTTVPSELRYEVLLDAGQDYDLYYWVDSNIGGGTARVCDAPPVDYQWHRVLASVPARTYTLTLSFDTSTATHECAAFASGT